MVKYNDQISRYITELFADQDETLRHVRNDTPKRGLPAISIQPEEGRFLQFLVRTCNTMKALEIGTLGGFSGIWIARGLSPGGRLITIEKEQWYADVAQEHFNLAGVEDRVEIRVGEAQALLTNLTNESPFDFIFIDADKARYSDFFTWGIHNTRQGGVIAAHNAFRGFSTSGGYKNDQISQAILTLNRKISSDPRVISTIFPAGDGTLVAVKIA
jgi:caffeoyl-CoA O-methyltransferase